MNDKYVISKADRPDVPELESLVNSAYRGNTSRTGWTTEADYLDGIRVDQLALTEIIDSPDSLILKCVQDSKIIGCVQLKTNENELYVGMLTVSPDIQNQGIGKLLLQECENFARQNRLNIISMTVISLREELIDWYERRGFTKTTKTLPFPSDPRFGSPKQQLEFIIMEKSINDIN